MSLEFGYLLLDLFLLTSFVFFAHKATDKKKSAFIVAILLLLWHLFIFLISQTDLLMNYSLPPRLVVFFILPSFVFTGVLFYIHRKNKWIYRIPEHWIIFLQSFRIFVEVLLYYTAFEGILNPEVTIQGYNYDMIFGITAPIVGYSVVKNKKVGKEIAFYWNFIGLLVLTSIIGLFFISLYNPEVFGSKEPLISLTAMEFPYVLVASFMMPSAVFLHIWSLMQLKKD